MRPSAQLVKQALSGMSPTSPIKSPTLPSKRDLLTYMRPSAQLVKQALSGMSPEAWVCQQELHDAQRKKAELQVRAPHLEAELRWAVRHTLGEAPRRAPGRPGMRSGVGTP